MLGSSLRRNKSHSSSQNLLDGSYSGASKMRNWPLFLFLTGLVFFFYVFYVYQAVSTELSMKKEQLELQFRQQRILKEEMIDLKADLEKSRGGESSLKTDYESMRSKYEECQSSLRSIKLRSDTLTDEKTAADAAAKEREREVEEERKRVADLERNNTSLQQLYDSQQAVVAQLNTTINMLQQELASHKTAAAAAVGGEAAVAAAADGAVAAAPAGGVVPTTTVVGKKAADLGELIKQEGAADKAPAAAAAAANEPLKEEERAAVENGEKPDPSGKKVEDELKGAAVMKDEGEGAKEDKEEIKGGEVPGKPGDRVKIEEELMVAEQNQVDDHKLVDAEKKEEGAEQEGGEAAAAAEAAEAADAAGGGAIQGGDYVDKDDNELEGEVKEDGAMEAPEEKDQ